MPYPARFYAALHRGSPGDLEHYQRVCSNAASVLELGCGYGRVVTALAAPGRTVVGVERDPALLAMAREAVAALPEDRRAGVELHAGDMRQVDLGRRFERVLVPFGGLYCLLDDDELHATLTHVARHLAPGGRVAFDVYRADAFHEEAEPDDLPDDAHAPLARVEVDGVAYEVLERSTWDKPRQRIDASYLYVDEAGHAVEGTIAQRYLLEPQLRAALARAGLEITSMTGSFEGRGSEEDEDELMIVEAAAR
jgi:SAM-dependent methyltransferase